MYLSRLILNPRSRQVQRELADPYEMHRTICRAFPNANYKANEPLGILFRVELDTKTGVPTLLVQSLYLPDWSHLKSDRKDYLLDEMSLPLGVANPSWKKFTLHLREGQVLAFRLRANPTKRLKENAKRIGIIREEEQLTWLERKIEAAGGTLISAHVTAKAKLRGKLFAEKADLRQMHFVSAQFDGILQVKDPDLLAKSVAAGIGSGKCLGFGLLSLAPLRC
jgi:CRISPR system Cascade subunit CasE